MKCTYCGYENEATNDFCSNCGKKLQESADNKQKNLNQTANQSNFNVQSNGYGQPTNGYTNQPNGYGQPTNGYTNQPNGYGQPTNGYTNQPNGYGQQKNGYVNQPNGTMLEKDFYQRFASKSTKSWAIVMIIMCFLSAVVGVIQIGLNVHELQLAMMFSNVAVLLVIISVIEIVYYIIMGILLLAKKKWIFTLIIAIVEVITRAFIIIISETFTYQGVFFLIVSIICTIVLKKVNDAYKIYKSTGNIPERPI